MDERKHIIEVLDHQLSVARRSNEALKPRFEAQRDITKILVSLASAMLVFTVTFSTSLIKPDSTLSLRYSVAAFLLALVASLSLSIWSLLYSTGLGSLEALVMSKTTEIQEADKQIRSTVPIDLEPLHRLMDEALQTVSREDKISRRLFKASLVCYGAAVLIFTVIGLRQLLC